MAGYNFNQSYFDRNRSPGSANRSPGRHLAVHRTANDEYNTNEPMVTEVSDASKAEFCKTQELLQMLESIRPLIDTSRQEVATATEKLASQAKETNDKITKQEKEVDDLRNKLAEKKRVNQSIEDKYHTVNNRLEESQKVNATLLQKITELTTEQKCHKRDNDNLSQNNMSLKEQLKKIKKEKSKLDEELNTMKMRLSKVLGNKISDNNPDIADLSDINRPTKIGERYSELYDNEWTDAFEVFNGLYDDEKTSIKDLLAILKFAKRHCGSMAEEQSKSITEALYLTNDMDQSQADVKKQIKDMRKETATLSMIQVQKRFNEVIMSKASNRGSEFTAVYQNCTVQTYMKKCVEICWLMSVQDPPLTLGVDVRENETFDTSKYKHYTRTGDRIEYLVWPEMYLKPGALLCKGVAQAAGRMQSARERRRREDSADDVNERPQTAPPKQSVEFHPTAYHNTKGNAGFTHRRADQGANDQMDVKSTSSYVRGPPIVTPSTKRHTEVQTNVTKLQYSWEDLKLNLPKGVKYNIWDDFLFYKRYAPNKNIEIIIGNEYHACLQHYNFLVTTETDI